MSFLQPVEEDGDLRCTTFHFTSLYEHSAQALLRDTGRQTFEATEILQGLDVQGYRPGRVLGIPAHRSGIP